MGNSVQDVLKEMRSEACLHALPGTAVLKWANRIDAVLASQSEAVTGSVIEVDGVKFAVPSKVAGKIKTAIASRPAIEQEATRYRFLRDQANSAQIAAFVARRRTRLAADRVCDSGIEIAAVLIEGETK